MSGSISKMLTTLVGGQPPPTQSRSPSVHTTDSSWGAWVGCQALIWAQPLGTQDGGTLAAEGGEIVRVRGGGPALTFLRRGPGRRPCS